MPRTLAITKRRKGALLVLCILLILSSMDRRQKKDQTDSTLLKYFCHQIQEQVLLGSPFALPALTVHLSHDESVSI